MGNFRTDVSGLAKLQVKKTGSYFGKHEAILMIDKVSLLECKQVVQNQVFKNNCFCLIFFTSNILILILLSIFLHLALYL